MVRFIMVECTRCALALAVAVSTTFSTSSLAVAGDDPFADSVVEYNPGTGASPAYMNPLTALGSPERFTGEGIFPSVVSAFSPPFGTDEIVSIGAGGHLTVHFNSPITNDPNNLYGIDLLI